MVQHHQYRIFAPLGLRVKVTRADHFEQVTFSSEINDFMQPFSRKNKFYFASCKFIVLVQSTSELDLPNPGLEIETLSLKSTLVKDLAITTGSLFEILRNSATTV